VKYEEEEKLIREYIFYTPVEVNLSKGHLLVSRVEGLSYFKIIKIK
jgi:hypothetical protein